MNIMMWIFFGVFIVTGVIFNFVLYYQDKHHEQNTSFLTSERLLIFIVEILIAVIGFGLTLTITNYNERENEKDKAIQMLVQTIEYTDKQIANEGSYLRMRIKEEVDDQKLFNSNVISLTYYQNILSNEVILQNANMNTYGDIMRYLIWMENANERAEAALNEAAVEGDEESKDTQEDAAATEEDQETEVKTTEVYNQMYWRKKYLEKTRDLLWICCEELSERLSAEEAAEMRQKIQDAPLKGYECITK